MTIAERFAALLAEAQEEAYARGWREAIEAVTHAATTISSAPKGPVVANGHDSAAPQISPEQAKSPRGRPPTAVAAIVETINEHPGLRGYEIMSHLTAKGIQSNDRTVRSALRRLKGNQIWQRSQRWYPKHSKEPNQSAEVEPESTKDFGEAIGPPPH